LRRRGPLVEARRVPGAPGHFTRIEYVWLQSLSSGPVVRVW
jgi:hypothetical protein